MRGCFWLIGVLALTTALAAQDDAALQRLRQQRRELAQRPRRIVANNDGCDALYYPGNKPTEVKTFLDLRTTNLAGTQVDTIVYCTISSGFSFFTHDTKAGTLLTHQPKDFGLQPQSRNVSAELIELGTDCLQAVVDYGHANGQEVFWSMRMNDTHDASYTPEKPYLLFPPLKQEHPEWLVGDPVKRTPFGRWSSVDYAVPEIRELAFRYLEEVCRNYDIDGLELDWFRHLCYFKSTATGGVADDAEREMMTDLLRRVRAMTEEVGLERGRPILIAMRTPDSIEYCREMGLDIEQWLSEGLLDAWITTGYFQLNPWRYTVDLAHRYGVAAWPCLSDSRVQGQTRFKRASIESYRGRAMAALGSGADAIHIFNYFNPNGALFRELGDPAGLAGKDKLYFTTLRDGNPNSWLNGGAKYANLPLLVPNNPRPILRDEPLETELDLAEDFAAGRAAAGDPTVTLHLELPLLRRAEQVAVTFNGQPLAGGTLTDGWLDLPVPVEQVKQGVNQVALQLLAAPVADTPKWTIEWTGPSPPAGIWSSDRGSAATEAKPLEDGLLIADRGEAPGDYLYYRYPWAAAPGEPTEIEVELKVVEGSSFVIFGDGERHERLGFYPDRIQLHSNAAQRYEMDTTDAFHTYRIALDGDDLKVYVDDQLRLDAPGVNPVRGRQQNSIAFGAANSTWTGSAIWRALRTTPDSLSLRDLALSIRYPAD